ncbi:MAG: methylmalonyl-CoA mutase [Rhodospirillales bacterium]|nr:methylmalonyl-CoA mutase [Rhodospirillales bacterium]
MSDLAQRLRAWSAIAPPAQAEKATGSAGLPLPASYAAPSGERPGQYPFARGIAPRGYLDEPWVMGLYSGYASPKETNARFKTLLATGQTGLSIALDLPTQIGLDSDHPLAQGEIGKVGVPINSVDDMLALLDGLPVDKIRQIRTTANAIGPVFLAIVVAALGELGIDPSTFRLLMQNDPLKEYSARGTWIFPPAASLKLAVDVVEYAQAHHPAWQPIQFAGYHVRDAGGTAVDEVAIATANGLAYLDEARARGVALDALAPSLFLFLSAGLDIFEEAAKFRAARRLWAKLLADHYGVPKEKAAIRIFAYTLGGALSAREPANNIARIAYEALAAVLGGVQTLATSSWDEAHSLPSEEAANLSVRTQQILAYETGIANVVDPLGGSTYVEDLTDRLEAAIAQEVAAILERGGAVAAIEDGSIEARLAEAAYRDFEAVQAGTKTIVGVNFKPRDAEAGWSAPFKLPPAVAQEAIDALAGLKAKRDPAMVTVALAAVRQVAGANANTVPALIAAAQARATLGEMVDALASVYGRQGAASKRALESGP